MALTEITNPRQSINGYVSDAASTTQLLYKYNESDLTDITNYFIEVLIPELNSLILYYTPDSNGDILFNIGPAIEQGIKPNVSLSYHIVVTPYRNGVAETAVTSIPQIFAVTSEVQILSTYGSNLYNYIAKPTNPGDIMTLFDEPKIWQGWNKKVSAISMDYSSMNMEVSILNINKNAITALVPDAQSVSNPGILEYILPETILTEVYYMAVFATDVTDGQLLNIKTYSLNQECREPVMIEWVNSLGAWETWLFDREQAVTNITEEGLRYNIPINEDISTVRQTKKRYAQKDTQYITLKAVQLTQNELQGLHDIKQSQEVRLWLNKVGDDYVNVTVSSGYDDNFTTGKTNYEFSLNIELPDNFDFFKGKQY